MRNCFDLHPQGWDDVMNDDSYSIHSCEEVCFEEVEERLHEFNGYICDEFCSKLNSNTVIVTAIITAIVTMTEDINYNLLFLQNVTQ